MHLLIIAFDYDLNRATFFRSAPASGPQWGVGDTTDIPLAEAIHASTNAPVNYFDAPATFPDHPGRYWDGAISGCNNPILAAVTEAIVKTQGSADIVALSIGTGSVALPLQHPGDEASPYLQPVSQAGLVPELRKLATSILDDPPDIASFLAHVMTGSGIGLAKSPADSRIVRMSPLISPVQNGGEWTAPGSMTAAQFTYLANIGMDAIAQAEVDAIFPICQPLAAKHRSESTHPHARKHSHTGIRPGHFWRCARRLASHQVSPVDPSYGFTIPSQLGRAHAIGERRAAGAAGAGVAGAACRRSVVVGGAVAPEFAESVFCLKSVPRITSRIWSCDPSGWST